MPENAEVRTVGHKVEKKFERSGRFDIFLHAKIVDMPVDYSDYECWEPRSAVTSTEHILVVVKDLCGAAVVVGGESSIRDFVRTVSKIALLSRERIRELAKIGMTRNRVSSSGDEAHSVAVKTPEQKFDQEVREAIRKAINRTLTDRLSGHVFDLSQRCQITEVEALNAIENFLKGRNDRTHKRIPQGYLRVCAENYSKSVGNVNAKLVAKELGRKGREPERSLHRDLRRYKLPPFSNILDDVQRSILRDLLTRPDVCKLDVARAIGCSPRGVIHQIKRLGLKVPEAWLWRSPQK